MKKAEVITPEKKQEIIQRYKLHLTYLNNSKHVIAGIDQSLTKTGVIIMNSSGQIIFEKLVTPKKLKGVERLQFIRNEVMQVLRIYQVTVVAIENYSFGSKGRSLFNLGEIGGVLRLAFYDNKIKFFEVSPASLKSFISENGGADKEMMRKAVLKKYKLDIVEDNICDAFSLARMCLVLGDALPEFSEKGGAELLRRIRNKYMINLF